MKRIHALWFAVLFCFGGVALGQGKVEITFWHAFGGDRALIIERMVEDFNYTHPNIHVSVEFKGSYRDTLNAAILAAQQGNPPHVVQIFEVGTQLAIDSGIFVPIQDLATEDELMPEDFIEGVADYYKIGGKFYSVPWNSSNPVLYYNKDIFVRAGLDPDNPPRTFEELLIYSQKIISSGAAELALSAALHSWYFEQWMACMDELLLNNDNGRTGRATESFLDSLAAKTIVAWWGEMAKNGYWAYTGKLEDWDGAEGLFVSGQAAMLLESTSEVAYLRRVFGKSLGVAPFPYPAKYLDGTPTKAPVGFVVGGASLWITKDHPLEELQAAKEFVLWMSNVENTIRWHKLTGYFPVRKKAVEVLDFEGWFDKYPEYAVAFSQLLNSQSTYATRGALTGAFLEIRTIIGQAIEKVIAGRATVEQALAEAKRRADEAIKRYNASVSD